MPLSPDELLSRFRGLLDAYRAVRDPLRAGEGNLRCDQCLDCNRCRFCVQCMRCDDCSNCEQCEDCVRCTRSRSSRRCTACNFVELSDGCEDSQYLTLCLACTRCEQCFACVGLQGESYCILNQRYSRKEYFIIVQGLKKRLEEQGPSLMNELATASRGLWTGMGTSTEGFAVTGGGVRAIFSGAATSAGSTHGPAPLQPSPAPLQAAVEEDDPWSEGVVPRRVEGAPSAPASRTPLSSVPG